MSHRVKLQNFGTGIRSKILMTFLIALVVVTALVITAVQMEISIIERASSVEAEHIALSIAAVDRDGANHDLPELQKYVELIGKRQKRDLVVVDVTKLGIADSDVEEVGGYYTYDPHDEVGDTIKDGLVRVFEENNERHPEEIMQIVVPLRQRASDQTSPIVGAVILEYTQIYDSLMAAERPTLILMFGLGAAAVLSILALGYRLATKLERQVNDEHKSTNSELKISKAELQSLNEKLITLNAQLRETVDNQRDTARDLQNILDSSQFASAFLDKELSVRFLTPAAKFLFNAADSDIGRSVHNLERRFNDENFSSDIQSVLAGLAPPNREIDSHTGGSYLRRVLPYRGGDGRVDGVVITFGDITEIKAAESKVGAARAYSDNIIKTVRQPLVVLDTDSCILSANPSFYEAFEIRKGEAVGRSLTKAGAGHLEVPAMHAFLNWICTGHISLEGYDLEIDLPSLRRRTFLLNARPMRDESSSVRKILVAFDDITEHKHITEVLEAEKMRAERANLGKSRFLAAASHDLRQPLQTLSLLQGMFARRLKNKDTLVLVEKLDETVNAMSNILNTLLDINQLETGSVQPELIDFRLDTLLIRLRDEFAYPAKIKRLGWHVVPCTLFVNSDARLLEQIVRNLLSNAFKYTSRGKILLGCRRRGDKVQLEVWDTGIGIPAEQLNAIFDEYHQLDNPARARHLGLGLGLAIVQRVGDLMKLRIDVHSRAGRGSVFTIELPRGGERSDEVISSEQQDMPTDGRQCGTILIIEDDPQLREVLDLLFKEEGYSTLSAMDGTEVKLLLTSTALRPDFIVADYNLPGRRTGLQVISDLRRSQRREIPALILTGDISADTLHRIVEENCAYLLKPVNADQLMRAVRHLMTSERESTILARAGPVASSVTGSALPTVFLVDDAITQLAAVGDMLRQRNLAVETYRSGEAFLTAYQPGSPGCLLVDGLMPGTNGIELLNQLSLQGLDLPSVVITGHGDVAMAVEAMKAGAVDFIEKPAQPEQLLAVIDSALDQVRQSDEYTSRRKLAAASIAALTPREREVLNSVVEGLSDTEIAALLRISERTVKKHRAAVMKRTGVTSLPDLIRFVMQAAVRRTGIG